MWRLWNKLFGWHYVCIEGRSDLIFKVDKINDKFYIFVQFAKENAALQLGNDCNFVGFVWPWKYIPLTFKPEELIK